MSAPSRIDISVRRRDIRWIIPLIVLSMVIFGIAAFLDPEPYHDGSQLPAAIAVSEGLVVHRDVFSGYGFLTAWLHGAVVAIFGPNLLAIRLFTSVVLVLVTLLLFLLTRVAVGNRLISFLVAAVWVVAWPGQAVIWGTPLFPWPSVIFLVFQLGAVLFTLRGLESPAHRTSSFAIAGLLVGLGILTRINYGGALAIALLIALLVLNKSKDLQPRDLFIPIAAALGVVIVLLGVIAIQGALVPFFDQSILGPLQGKATVKPTEWFYIENGYLWGSLGVLTVSLVVWFLATRSAISRRYLWLVSSLGVTALTIWASTAIESSPARTLILSRLTWAPALDIQAMQPMYFSVLIVFLVVASLVVVMVRQAIFRRSPSCSSDEVLLIVLALAALASLFQLFPVADPNHLWWAAPIPLVLLAFVFARTVASDRQAPVVAVLLLPPLVLAPFTMFQVLDRPRVQINTGALSGMWIGTDYQDSVHKLDRLLAETEPGSVEFKCVEGLFSVWNGSYLAAGPGYVDYAYGLDAASDAAPPQRRFDCVALDDGTESQLLEDPDSKVIADWGLVKLSYFANTRLLEIQP